MIGPQASGGCHSIDMIDQSRRPRSVTLVKGTELGLNFDHSHLQRQSHGIGSADCIKLVSDLAHMEFGRMH
jgi:hypothetical protein